MSNWSTLGTGKKIAFTASKILYSVLKGNPQGERVPYIQSMLKGLPESII